MDFLKQFIQPELLVTVPVLYFIGIWMHKTDKMENHRIPLYLGCVGVAFAVLYTLSTATLGNYQDVMGAVFMAITQGILCSGASVYVNQLVKQSNYRIAAQSVAPPESEAS